MTHGRILIAHTSKTVRSILRRRVLAEAPEFIIDEVEAIAQAADLLKTGSIDIAFCDEVLATPTECDPVLTLRGERGPRNLGFIFLVSEATTRERRAELATFGTHVFLEATCTSSDIAAAIATVFDPRQRRQHRRVCIPGTQARIQAGTLALDAEVINVSTAGILCEFACPKEVGGIVMLADVVLRFPNEFDSEPIDGIRAGVMRIHVTTRGEDLIPERMRAAWQFFDMPSDSYRRLDAIVGLAEEEAPPESRSLMAR